MGMGIKWNSCELKVRMKIGLAALESSMEASHTEFLHCLGKAAISVPKRCLSLHHYVQFS